MAYRLRIGDDLPDSVRDVARGQLAGAIEELEGGGADDPAKAIHAARKRLKKTRALLRLVRPALGDKRYRRENDALRAAAARLSATRDADVLVATVDALDERLVGRVPAPQLAAVRAALVSEAAAQRGEGQGVANGEGVANGAPAATAEAVARDLREVQARIDGWPLESGAWDVVLAGSVRAYERGRAAYAQAVREPSVEHLHDWRKRVKDLWYHHRLLERAWPPLTEAFGEQAHVLSELLGDDHDLAVLRDRFERAPALATSVPVDLDPLLAAVAERRAELQAEAQRIAARLYAEKPRAFERRLGRWIDASLADAAAAGGAAAGSAAVGGAGTGSAAAGGPSAPD